MKPDPEGVLHTALSFTVRCVTFVNCQPGSRPPPPSLDPNPPSPREHGRGTNLRTPSGSVDLYPDTSTHQWGSRSGQVKWKNDSYSEPWADTGPLRRQPSHPVGTTDGHRHYDRPRPVSGVGQRVGSNDVVDPWSYSTAFLRDTNRRFRTKPLRWRVGTERDTRYLRSPTPRESRGGWRTSDRSPFQDPRTRTGCLPVTTSLCRPGLSVAWNLHPHLLGGVRDRIFLVNRTKRVLILQRTLFPESHDFGPL